MNHLFENFDKIIDAPNGIKKARELVLQLAIQGKLTEEWRKENPDVEPASKLLKKIKAEKEKLIAEGKIKKQKKIEFDVDELKPFDIPQTWKWTRLHQLGEIFSGNSISAHIKASKYSNITLGLDYIGTKDVDFKNTQVVYNNGVKIPFGEPKFKIAHKDTVLICSEGGSAGRKVGIVEKDVCFGNKLLAIEPYITLDKYFIYSVYRSSCFFEMFSSKMTGIIKGISLNNFKLLFFPLPPLKEQKQIVKKVNSMMSFLDELEEKQNNREAKRIKINNSSLDKLIKSESTKEFKQNWNRITQNFETLYTVPQNVVKLKQTILQLAVQGKLTEEWRKENPNVEPASKLLKKIKAEKEKLIAEGKIKKQKALPPIKEKSFSLPNKWEWHKLSMLCEGARDITYGIVKQGPHLSNGVKTLRTSDVRFRKILTHKIRFVLKEIADKYFRTYLAGGEILMAIRGSLGGCAIVPDEMKGYNISRELALIPISKNMLNSYVLNVLTSPYIQDVTFSKLRGIAYKGLNLGLLNDFLIPVPPYSEQKQIVKKVDELMSLCNKLEANIKLKTEEQEKLVSAVVSQI